MLKILLDSTYLLPFIGIDVGIPDDELDSLLTSENQIYVNEISLFEILGKGLRELIKNKLLYSRLQVGLVSLKEDDRFSFFTITESLIQSDLIARIYLAGLHDVPDCIILSSAIQFDLFLTEAEDIPQISVTFKEFQHLNILNWMKFKKNFL